jgi:hypothetical protein
MIAITALISNSNSFANQSHVRALRAAVTTSRELLFRAAVENPLGLPDGSQSLVAQCLIYPPRGPTIREFLILAFDTVVAPYFNRRRANKGGIC